MPVDWLRMAHRSGRFERENLFHFFPALFRGTHFPEYARAILEAHCSAARAPKYSAYRPEQSPTKTISGPATAP